MKLRTVGVDDTRGLGRALSGVLQPGDVVVLAGDLGSGKTALVQGIGTGLGVDDPVVSPSFVIVREYRGRLPLRHVDVYRLDRFQELHDLGFDDLIGGEWVTVIEWGDRIDPILPADRLEVALDYGPSDDDRTVVVTARGASWAARAESLAAACAPWTGEGGPAC